MDAPLHPWNRAFTWAGHDGARRRLSADEVAQFDAEGFVVVPDLVEPAQIAAVTDDL